MRDKIKNEEYFEKYIANTIERKRVYIERIRALDNPEQGFINSRVTLDLFSRNILIGKYSAGEKVNDILPDYEEALKWFLSAYNSTSYYVQLLCMLSIGIMIQPESVNKIADAVKKDNVNDYLIDFLLSKTVSFWDIENRNVRFPVPYIGIRDVIDIASSDKQMAIKRLKQYLEKEWYSGHSDVGWYGNHKSKHDTYCGYWSFESGAVVKILNLDDSILKDSPYYPYDMVHLQ